MTDDDIYNIAIGSMIDIFENNAMLLRYFVRLDLMVWIVVTLCILIFNFLKQKKAVCWLPLINSP